MQAETEYAVRTVYELSLHKEFVSVKTICEYQNLPVKFVEKILKKLKKSGIVKSKKGAFGGYRLQKKLQNINLKNIVDITQDSYGILCFNPKKNMNFCIKNRCYLLNFWKQVKNNMDNLYSQMSLDKINNNRGKNDIFK